MKLLFLLYLFLPIYAFALRPLKIVHIGDSQSVGHFGSELNRHLKTIPEAQVSSFANGGSGAENWITGQSTPWDYYEYRYGQAQEYRAKNHPTPKLEDLLKNEEGRDQLVVVQLGGNQLARSDEYNKKWIEKVVKKIKEAGSSCVWIGPSNRRTNSDKMDHFYQLLSQSLQGYGCHLIDSRKYTSYDKLLGDGVHFNYPEGEIVTKQWAEKSYNEIVTYLTLL